MSDPIIPNAQHRVLDADVLPESFEDKMQRAKAYSASKAPGLNRVIESESSAERTLNGETDRHGSAGAANTSNSAKDAKSANKSSLFKRYQRPLMWVGVLGAGLWVLVWTRPDTGWLVDKINVLQTQVAQLQSDNQALHAQLTEQKQSVSQSVSESVLANVTAHINEQVKPEMQALLQDALKTSQESTLTRPGEDTASLEAFKINITQQIQQMEQTVAQRLEQSRTAQEQHLAQTLQSKPIAPLNVAQIEEWISQINLQWQLGGASEHTRAQLLAFETTLARSSIAQQTVLARLLGQDLALLQSLQTKAHDNTAQVMNALKAAIRDLPAAAQPPINAVKAAETPPTLSTGETLDTASATQHLLGKLGELMSVKKRDDAQSLTQVEAILMHDVILQRLTLLVDRLDWALQTQSLSSLQAALADVRALLKKSLSTHVATFEPLLAPLDAVRFEFRTPLSITQWNASTPVVKTP